MSEKRQLKADEDKKRRANYIYPKIIKALDSKIRRRILTLLLESKKDIPFSEIKEKLGSEYDSLLVDDLGFLQRAWLIERRTEVGSPRILKHPYHSFYRLSEFGKEIITAFSQAVLNAIRISPETKDKT